MKKENLIIQTAINTTDSDGYVVQDWADAVTLKGVMLPYGQQLALKEYGYDAPVKYRVFTFRKNSAIKVGARVNVRGLFLFVVYIADYGKVQDILLNTEVGGKGG